jgi:hypothetical protein
MVHVLVNGKFAIEGERFMNLRSGRVLSRNEK